MEAVGKIVSASQDSGRKIREENDHEWNSMRRMGSRCRNSRFQ